MILPFKIDVLSMPCIDDKRGRSRTILEYPKIVGIYKITSSKGSIYIGLSNDIYYRVYTCYKKLRCKQQLKIYNSLKKYGLENHSFEIIHIIKTDGLTKSYIRQELNNLEVYYIKLFNSFFGDNEEFGLNLTRGGESMDLTDEARRIIKIKNTGRKMPQKTRDILKKVHTGRKNSDETKRRQSEAKIGKKFSEETRKKLSESHKGKKRTIESIEKGRIKQIGQKRSKETIQKISGENHWLYDKNHSEETKLKISNSLKGRFVGEKNPSFGKPKSEKTKSLIRAKKLGTKRSEESKRKQADSIRGEKHHNYGKKASLETRKKLSESHKGKKQSKEAIEKTTIKIKEYWSKEENRIKRSNKMKEYWKRIKMGINTNEVEKI